MQKKSLEPRIPHSKLRKQLKSGHARARGICLLRNRLVTSTFVDAFHAARAKCHEEECNGEGSAKK